jgi:hypothetical protein
MRKIALVLAILGTTLVSALYSAPAHAQATRTWISGVGDDANPCSRTAPCKTFAGAIAKTAPGGEINCLDPGGFGALTITKAITLDCQPMSNGGVLVAGTNGIVVAAGPTDKVVMMGLDFEGLGSGLNGIQFSSGLEVIIINCTIRDFVTNGVAMQSSTAGARLVIQNSQIINNGTAGTANTGGVNVQSSVNNVALIFNSLLENNQNYDLQANGSNSIAGIANSYFTGATGTTTSLLKTNGGTIASWGPSNVVTSGSPSAPATAFQ